MMEEREASPETGSLAVTLTLLATQTVFGEKTQMSRSLQRAVEWLEDRLGLQPGHGPLGFPHHPRAQENSSPSLFFLIDDETVPCCQVPRDPHSFRWGATCSDGLGVYCAP